jgi:hypothetical protein
VFINHSWAIGETGVLQDDLLKGERIMSRCLTTLSAVVIAAALVGGTAFVSNPAEAAKMSAADKAALKEKTADCKKQAKDQKLGLIKSRRFVKECVAKN